jgi:uncharacterized membrane protein
MTFGLVVHVLAAVIWVGGIFFAFVVLRRAGRAIDPHVRLDLWGEVFRQFFPWVWGCIAALLLSGYGMVFFALGGFAAAGVHVHIMQATGWLMIALFLHLYFAPWPRMRRALEAGDYKMATRQLKQIRWMVGANVGLGLLTSAIGASGRYWG